MDIVDHWKDTLSRVEDTIKEWTLVSKNWKLLVNIFLKSEDIKT